MLEEGEFTAESRERGGGEVPSKRERELCGLVEEALETVGSQWRIAQEVHRVVLSRRQTHVRIDLTLRMRKESPVCCPELGCPVPYLGSSRYELPVAVADRLGLPQEPRVQLVVQMAHEPGYEYSELQFPPKDGITKYDPDWFIEREQ